MAELRREDLAAAWPLWLTTGWNQGYRIDQATFVRSWQGSLLRCGLFEDGELVAIGRANGDGVLYAMIHDIVVHPEWRGAGLGRAVVTELVSALRAREVRVIQLMAAADQAAFYEGLGFRRRPDDRPGMEYGG